MNKTTTELEIKISGGRITNAKVLDNGICKLTIETAAQKEPTIEVVVQEKTVVEKLQDTFVLVEASKLSLDDEFMKYKPKTEGEEKFKKDLTEAIKKGVKDFWAPRCDPSFNEDGTGICYVEGKRPAVGKSYNWWEKAAKEFCPERQSHLGIKSERVAFLGWYIKKLIKSGWRMEDAWYAVCNDSKKLGHYWNSENAKHAFEKTGSREVCGFCDLANTYKILAKDERAGGFWLAGGGDCIDSDFFPLAVLVRVRNFSQDVGNYDGVGWLVLY